MGARINHRSRIPIIAIALFVIAGICFSYAWFSSRDSVINSLESEDGLTRVKLQEVFVGHDNWKPGETVIKRVSVVNPSSANALVRVSFVEMLEVSLPAAGEPGVFDQVMQDAGKRPVLLDRAQYPASDWTEVTTTANPSIGGISLGADYSPAKVYAKYDYTSSTASYSFAVWAPIIGTSFAGQYQDVTYDRAWDSANKELFLSNIKYWAYQGVVFSGANWAIARPASSDIGQSVAETIINRSLLQAYDATRGNYPNCIQLNYDNIEQTPTPGRWIYNEADGYFYYIGLVQSGEQTPNMLRDLLLSEAADGAYYSNLTYELTVKLDAIQDTKDAVASLWTGLSGDLKIAIDALCTS